MLKSSHATGTEPEHSRVQRALRGLHACLFRRCPGVRRWEDARNGDVPRPFQAHLDSCEACRRRWMAEQALSLAVRNLETACLRAGAQARVRDALLIRADARPARRRERSWVAFSLASVALAIVGASIALVWLRASREPRARIASAGVVTVPTRSNVRTAALPSLDTQVIPSEPSPTASTGPQLSLGRGQSTPARASRPTMSTRREGRPLDEAHRGASSDPRSLQRYPRSELEASNGETAGSAQASELAFRQGWDALRDDRPNEAAARFAGVADTSPLREDAAYWQAVAWARAGRLEWAARGLAEFIERYPQTARRDEVAVVLGWVYLRRHQNRQAASYFAEGLLAQDPHTRARAARGLAALELAGLPAHSDASSL